MRRGRTAAVASGDLPAGVVSRGDRPLAAPQFTGRPKYPLPLPLLPVTTRHAVTFHEISRTHVSVYSSSSSLLTGRTRRKFVCCMITLQDDMALYARVSKKITRVETAIPRTRGDSRSGFCHFKSEVCSRNKRETSKESFARFTIPFTGGLPLMCNRKQLFTCSSLFCNNIVPCLSNRSIVFD